VAVAYKLQGAILLRKQSTDISTRQSHYLVGEHSLPHNIHDSLRLCFRARATGLRRRRRRVRAAEQDNARRQVALPRVDPALRSFLGNDQGAVFPSLLLGAAVQLHADRDYVESRHGEPPAAASRQGGKHGLPCNVGSCNLQHCVQLLSVLAVGLRDERSIRHGSRQLDAFFTVDGILGILKSDLTSAIQSILYTHIFVFLVV